MIQAPATAHHSSIEQVSRYLKDASFQQAQKIIRQLLDDPGMKDPEWAYLGEHDRYVLLAIILRRYDAMHPWLYERCREVEGSPDGHIDLWAR